MPNHQLPPVFRFAPSPNGNLHIGHAYSALFNEKLARQADGKLLLRIEDVDRQRSRASFETAIYEDLEWLGIKFDEIPRRQSEHVSLYQSVLDCLIQKGLAYPSTVSRSEIAKLAALNPDWPRDPDGAFLPPVSERNSMKATGNCAIRLNMSAALAACPNPVSWLENGNGHHMDASLWGDVVLKSRDGCFAYHLAVVVDDALQSITHIVRGQDLFAATAIHRVLQNLLGYAAPNYLHHQLILDQIGEKLAKSRHSPSLRSLQQDGVTSHELRRRLGFNV